MNKRIALPLILSAALVAGCSSMDMGSQGGSTYGETARPTSYPTSYQTERDGTIVQLRTVGIDSRYKLGELGVGTAVGAVAGGVLGAGVGDSTAATVAGAVLGGLAGTYAENRMGNKNAQEITVNMPTSGTVTILQPLDDRLREGMRVRVEGSGENARVVPRY